MEAGTSSCQIVFQTPELLSLILSFLDDDESLSSAIRVNRRWFQWGIEWLWRHPELSQFSNLDASRRQIYASATAILDFDGDSGEDPDGIWETLAELEFPKLKELYLTAPYCYSHVEGYLQPSLSDLVMHQAPLMPCFLERIRSRCPHLRCLGIHCSAYGSADTFIDLLRSLPSVQSVYLLQNKGPQSVLNAILLYLASRDNLRKLSMTVNKEALRTVSRKLAAPFASLRTLTVSLSPEAIAPLLACVKLAQVPELDILCSGSINGYLHELSSLTFLQSLLLDFTDEPVAAEVVALKNLMQLKRLSINWRDHIDMWGDFNDSHLDSLLSKLPKLVELEIRLPCDFCGNALSTVSKHCPLLKICVLKGNVDEHRLESNDVFPHLKDLTIKSFLQPDDEDGDTFAQRFRKQCPKLERLEYSAERGDWDDDFYYACIDIVDEPDEQPWN